MIDSLGLQTGASGMGMFALRDCPWYTRYVLTAPECYRRAEVLSNHHKLAAGAKERKITDPSKIILSAIPRYEATGKHVKLQEIVDEAQNHDAYLPKQE